MRHTLRFLSVLLIFALLASIPVPAQAKTDASAQTIRLNSVSSSGGYTHTATLDGKAVPEYDYVWHADPTAVHDEVKNSPAEYHTGTAPSSDDAVYIAHDIYYYPMLEESKFRQVSYDGETEWVYMYEAAGYENYIFSTLPSLRTGFPSQMMHTEEEAYQNAVLHITQPGTYILEGTWHGQILVDLGKDAFDDPTQKVTLILNGVQIECTVAPGVIFSNVYECDNGWEDADAHSHRVDTTDAGANVVIADGTVNTVSGTNIFRILKTQYKDDDATDPYPAQKKRLKIDGSFYSYMSMNITGGEKSTGVLNIISGFEGLNSELHLTVNGGNINIYSQDDGINVNEDGVSVLTVNGGNLHICAGLGAEGDGIDSNGYLVVNGGTLITAANPAADSGLDSDCGSFVNGGTVVALGAAMDWAESDDTVGATQAVLNMRFQSAQSDTEAIIITDGNDKVVFAYDPDKDEVSGTDRRTYSGAIVSAAGLQVGETYRIYIGGDVTGEESSGVYDPATVTGFTGAVRQCYSGDAVGGMGNMGGGFRPGDQGQMPGGNQGQMPGGQQGQVPQQPGDGGMTPPEGFDPMGGMNQGQTGGATCTYTAEFTLSKTVNAFSNVTDLRHDLQKTDGEESYTCTVCGSRFADAEGNTLLSQGAASLPGGNMLVNNLLWFLGGAATASAVFAIVLLIRKKKNQKAQK